MLNTYLNKIKAVLALKFTNWIFLALAPTLDKTVGIYGFWDLDKFLFVLISPLPLITSFFSVIPTNVSKFSD